MRGEGCDVRAGSTHVYSMDVGERQRLHLGEAWLLGPVEELGLCRLGLCRLALRSSSVESMGTARVSCT